MEFLDEMKEVLMKEYEEQKRLQALIMDRNVADKRARERTEDEVEKRKNGRTRQKKEEQE